jgi:hypothetical protein
VNRGPQRDGELAPTLGVCSIVSLSVLLLESMAHAHAHSSTVVWDALSSLPSLRRGMNLGLLRVGVSAPSAPPTRLQLSHCLHVIDVLHRVGAVAQLPGAMRMSPAAHYVERRKLVSPGVRHPKGAVCYGAHARVWQRIAFAAN